MRILRNFVNVLFGRHSWNSWKCLQARSLIKESEDFETDFDSLNTVLKLMWFLSLQHRKQRSDASNF